VHFSGGSLSFMRSKLIDHLCRCSGDPYFDRDFDRVGTGTGTEHINTEHGTYVRYIRFP
jgi:hypothetical protein